MCLWKSRSRVEDYRDDSGGSPSGHPALSIYSFVCETGGEKTCISLRSFKNAAVNWKPSWASRTQEPSMCLLALKRARVSLAFTSNSLEPWVTCLRSQPGRASVLCLTLTTFWDPGMVSSFSFSSRQTYLYHTFLLSSTQNLFLLLKPRPWHGQDLFLHLCHHVIMVTTELMPWLGRESSHVYCGSNFNHSGVLCNLELPISYIDSELLYKRLTSPPSTRD